MRIDKISVHDTVALGQKNNDVFGIQGYNLPRVDYPVRRGVLNCIAKDKRRKFAELASLLTKGVPGPGQYKT